MKTRTYKLYRWCLLIYSKMMYSNIDIHQLMDIFADAIQAEVQRSRAARRNNNNLKRVNT
jgi:hypothetical protein